MSRVAETIAAIATPPGRGGIGIVRVSGPDCVRIAERVTGRKLRPRHAEYAEFLQADGARIDRGIALLFLRPASYTGEDVLELHAHGGPVVLDMLLRCVYAAGARPAAPGEFTERAFLNGKLDLVQAEAVADLIDSASESAARAALRSLAGQFSARIDALRERLLDLRVRLETALDFPDEQIPFLSSIRGPLRDCRVELEELLVCGRSGRRLRAGPKAVIVGRPNVGKSSLMNQLLRVDRAIVADSPGTTRDTIEETVQVGGIALHIVDTAGLRDAGDSVEAEGVRRTRAAMQDADLILLVTDADGTTRELLREAQASAPRAGVVLIRNKIDLCAQTPSLSERDGITCVALSARTGAGIDLLSEMLQRETGGGADAEDAVLARERHLEALELAATALARAEQAAGEGAAPELVAEELRVAQECLGRITGAVGSDELLGEIFARFCIGK